MKNLSDEEKARLYDKIHPESPLIDPKVRKKNKVIMYVLIVIASSMFILAIYLSPVDDTPTRSTSESNTNKILAYHQAERYVKEHLKSPSTATFPRVSEYINHITGTDEQYKIVSWVDSQNSFGAMIRTQWSCVVKINGDRVRCEQLELL